jgi:hypothetical protein
MVSEFEEIGHSGGKITFNITTEDKDHRSLQVQFSSSRPVPLVVIAIYATPQGIPVESIHLGGIGQPWNPPPVPGCFPVFIASDSQGKFGHHCPHCNGYWRSAHGLTYALIVLRLRQAINCFRKPRGVMYDNTVKC